MKHSAQKRFLKESFVYRIINEEGWFQRKKYSIWLYILLSLANKCLQNSTLETVWF